MTPQEHNAMCVILLIVSLMAGLPALCDFFYNRWRRKQGHPVYTYLPSAITAPNNKQNGSGEVSSPPSPETQHVQEAAGEMSNWTSEWPTEAGMYWVHGRVWSSEIPQTYHVTVYTGGAAPVYICRGAFLYKGDCEDTQWQKAVPPSPPDFGE